MESEPFTQPELTTIETAVNILKLSGVAISKKDCRYYTHLIIRLRSGKPLNPSPHDIKMIKSVLRRHKIEVPTGWRKDYNMLVKKIKGLKL